MAKRREQRYPAKGVLIVSGMPNIVAARVGSKNRVPWLANEICHKALVKAWEEARAWLVGKYVIMPDHIHFFAAPGEQNIEFERWVDYWKTLTTRGMGKRRGGWQSRCWHHRLRDSDSYGKQWVYFSENPVRKGLVERAEDWQFQGELNVLRW